MPRLRDWRRERALLFLFLLAIAPVVWAMFFAVAFAAIRPDRALVEPVSPEVSVALRVIGNRVEATVTFSDPNPGDTHSAEFRWGDGTPLTFVTPVTSPIEACHVYATPGEFVVVALVRDSEGFEGSATATVTVGMAVLNPYLIPSGTDGC